MAIPKAVTWYVNRYGYHIEVIDGGQTIHEYFAGNHPHDSAEVLDAEDLLAVPESQLREFAQSTAVQIAEEFNIPLSCIEESEI